MQAKLPHSVVAALIMGSLTSKRKARKVLPCCQEPHHKCVISKEHWLLYHSTGFNQLHLPKAFHQSALRADTNYLMLTDASPPTQLAKQVAFDLVTLEDPQLTGKPKMSEAIADLADERTTDSIPGLDGSLNTYALLKEASTLLCKYTSSAEDPQSTHHSLILQA